MNAEVIMNDYTLPHGAGMSISQARALEHWIHTHLSDYTENKRSKKQLRKLKYQTVRRLIKCSYLATSSWLISRVTRDNSHIKRIIGPFIEQCIDEGSELLSIIEQRDLEFYKSMVKVWSLARLKTIAQPINPEDKTLANSLDSSLYAVTRGHSHELPSVFELIDPLEQSASLWLYTPQEGLPTFSEIALCCLSLLSLTRPMLKCEWELFSRLEKITLLALIQKNPIVTKNKTL